MGLIGLFRERLRGRRVGRAPRYRVADLPDNTLGRIMGTVDALDGQLLEAPLSGRPCVHYSIVIDEYFVGGYRELELAQHQDSVPFILVDDGHRAVVDPSHARISAVYDHVTESRAAFDADPRQRALLARYKLLERGWFATASLRYCEAIIEIGGSISIVGSGAREIDPTSSADRIYRERGSTRLRMAGSASTPLLISDHPGSR